MSNHSKHRLHLVDNFGLALCLTRGRSSNVAMLQLCRRAGASSLATGWKMHCRWVRSEVNVSDEPSRLPPRTQRYGKPCAGRRDDSTSRPRETAYDDAAPAPSQRRDLCSREAALDAASRAASVLDYFEREFWEKDGPRHPKRRGPASLFRAPHCETRRSDLSCRAARGQA